MARTQIHVERVVFDHPLEHVWSLVSSFGAIKAWMPSIKWCKIDGDGIGSTRTVSSISGEVRETLEILDHKAHHISYRIQDPIPLPAKGGFGTWILESKGESSTLITWIADAEEVDTQGVAKIQPLYELFMKECLDGLKKALA